MKYIITEQQYKTLFENHRVEFPGINFFGGDWDMVEGMINNFTFNGEVITNLTDYKEYLIDTISKYVDEQYDIDMDRYNLYYDNERILTLSDRFVTTRFTDYEFDEDGEDFYKSYYYDELPYDVLKEIYDALF